jgi:hypothetical protein
VGASAEAFYAKAKIRKTKRDIGPEVLPCQPVIGSFRYRGKSPARIFGLWKNREKCCPEAT